MNKFKVGDKVEVIKLIEDSAIVKVGDVGTVVEIGKDGSEYPIRLKINKQTDYGFTEEELELVTNDDFKLEVRDNTYPIGITPKDIWLKKRKQEILDAIIRYTEAEIMIPIEWAKELRELEEMGV